MRSPAERSRLAQIRPGRTGEPNAQAQDQVGRQEALQDNGDREGAVYAVPQAPRHDQADQEANPSAARHQGPVQDRWRQYQAIFPAQRLSRSFLLEHDLFRKPASTPTFARAGFSGSCSNINQPQGGQPWPASNVASPVTPSTRRSSRPPRAITAGGRTPLGSPSRRSRRPINTPSGTASGASAPSGRCGSSG